MMEIIFSHLSRLCTMVCPRWCWTSCTWTPRTAARSTRHSPVGLSQRRRSGSSVRNGSVRTECSKILGPDTSSCSTCLHATVTRVSSATSSWSPWGRGRFTWVQPASTSNCVSPRCPGASTQTPVWHSGYTPVTRQTRGQPTSHCSNSSPASWESSRCARSSRAPCTSHRARWRGWRPQDTTGWSRSVKAGAITGIGSNTFGSLSYPPYCRVCYSNHASLSELETFVRHFSPLQITPCAIPPNSSKEEVRDILSSFLDRDTDHRPAHYSSPPAEDKSPGHEMIVGGSEDQTVTSRKRKFSSCGSGNQSDGYWEEVTVMSSVLTRLDSKSCFSNDF